MTWVLEQWKATLGKEGWREGEPPRCHREPPRGRRGAVEVRRGHTQGHSGAVEGPPRGRQGGWADHRGAAHMWEAADELRKLNPPTDVFEIIGFSSAEVAARSVASEDIGITTWGGGLATCFLNRR